jgi:hypothetical protein
MSWPGFMVRQNCKSQKPVSKRHFMMQQTNKIYNFVAPQNIQTQKRIGAYDEK